MKIFYWNSLLILLSEYLFFAKLDVVVTNKHWMWMQMRRKGKMEERILLFLSTVKAET
jgi:hypothetical protein